MYQAPDFVKISTKVEDVFASYGSSCIIMNMITETLLDPKLPCKDLSTVSYTYLELHHGEEAYQCYAEDMG